MEGAALAAKRAMDMATTQAWHTAIFGLQGYAGKLKGKKLSDFLIGEQRPRAQTGSEMLAIMRELKARGAPMRIRRVN